MFTQSLQAIILAAGKSSRFGTETSKLSTMLCGQPMILYSAKLCMSLNIPMTFIVGYQREVVENLLISSGIPDITFSLQSDPKGTGHALMCSQKNWHSDYLLIMNGDMPLVSKEIILKLIEKQKETDAPIVFVTAYNADPSVTGYGKVITRDGKVTIVEAKDAQEDLKNEHFVNAGVYLFKRSCIEELAPQLKPSPVTGELYITDFITLANNAGYNVETVSGSFDLLRGINTLRELWVAEHIKRSQLIAHHMEHGVRFSMPQTVHLDVDVEIGPGSFIGASAQLRSGTKIGKHVMIDAFTIIEKSIIRDQATILSNSVISESIIEEEAQVGPFAHLRNHTTLGKKSVIGNFVEVNKSVIGSSSKAKHLTYLGQAVVGDTVNIGAGTITCNYNGVSKHATHIQDGAHIGSNNSLVAPVTIGKNSITAAGSVITKDVPEDALAIARSHQENKLDYAPKLKAKFTALKK